MLHFLTKTIHFRFCTLPFCDQHHFQFRTLQFLITVKRAIDNDVPWLQKWSRQKRKWCRSRTKSEALKIEKNAFDYNSEAWIIRMMRFGQKAKRVQKLSVQNQKWCALIQIKACTIKNWSVKGRKWCILATVLKHKNLKWCVLDKCTIFNNFIVHNSWPNSEPWSVLATKGKRETRDLALLSKK